MKVKQTQNKYDMVTQYVLQLHTEHAETYETTWITVAACFTVGE